MKRSFMRVFSVITVSLMILSAVPINISAAFGNIYYISLYGSDANDGSFSAPFATFKKAAETMKAGDTCFVRGGTYYETLEMNMRGMANGEISFRAYNGEKVTLSGGEPLTNWMRHDGNIWVTDMNWDIYGGNGNMIFSDGGLCLEARWPNASASELLDKTKYAVLESNSAETNGALSLTESALPDGMDLTGAQIWCANGPSYWSTVFNIDEHDWENKTITFSDVFSTIGYRPKKGNIYYVKGKYCLLDSPGEWFKEGGKLYFYAPAGKDPNNMKIEAKKREYVINLNNSAYISFNGINARGGLISFDGNSNHCSFRGGVIESLDYKMVPGERGSAQGIILGGSNNLLSDCEIRNMFGEGVTLKGNGNCVVNNYIHDINFEHTYSDGIYINGVKHLISRNTVEKTGRGTIGGAFDSCIISYNDLSDSCRLSKDGGTVYLNSHNYNNSEFHHNILHGSMNNDGLQYGMYLDSMTSGMIIYRNLVYGMEPDTPAGGRLTLCLNPNSMGNLFVNNTFINTKPMNTYATKNGELKYDLSGCAFINNLFRSAMHDATEENLSQNGVVLKNNLHGEKDAFGDFWNDDYTLKDGSAAIDAGCIVEGITEEYSGDAPDCGAFEHGKEPWTAGHNFNVNYGTVYEQNKKIPYRNIIENCGFENNFNGWVNEDAERFISGSWPLWCKFSKDGSKSALMPGGSKLSRKVSGLEPFTSYKIGAFGMLAGRYTRADSYSSAYDRNLNSVGFAKKGETINGLGAIGALEYRVDFGSVPTDKLVLGIRDGASGQRVSVCIGELDRICAVLDIPSALPDIGWGWYTVDLGEAISGVQTVFIKFESSNFGKTTFAGFYPDYSAEGEYLSVSAVSDGGKRGEIQISSKDFDMPMPSFSVTTGAKGEIDLLIEKTGEKLLGYVDYISICKNPDGNLDLGGGFSVLGKAVRNADGEFYSNSEFAEEKFNMFELSFMNNSWEKSPITAILGIYDSEDKLERISSFNLSANSENKTNIILGTVMQTGEEKVRFFLLNNIRELVPLADFSGFNAAGN